MLDSPEVGENGAEGVGATLSGSDQGVSSVSGSDGDGLSVIPRKAAAKKTAVAKRARPRKSNTRKAAARKVPAKRTSATRTQRSFSAASFEDAMELANALQRLGAERARRITIFEELGRSADSGTSRQLIVNSGRYGLTTGGYQAEWIELTTQGKLATSLEGALRQRLRARFELAIQSIPPFSELYDEFVNKRFPSHSVLRDFLREKGYSDAELQECVDTFIVNGRFLGLLKTMAGAERLLSIEFVLDNLPPSIEEAPSGAAPTRDAAAQSSGVHDWATTCFYVTPIGDDESEQRQHSDLFLGSLVEPALADFGLNVIRADQIGKPGMNHRSSD